MLGTEQASSSTHEDGRAWNGASGRQETLNQFVRLSYYRCVWGLTLGTAIFFAQLDMETAGSGPLGKARLFARYLGGSLAEVPRSKAQKMHDFL